MNRQLRSCLNLLQPNLAHNVEKKQMRQKIQHDHHTQERSFEEGEEVYVKNYGRYGQKWLEGYVVTLRGPVSALVELTDGSRVRRHFDQMRRRYSETVKPNSSASHDFLPESLLLSSGEGSSESGEGVSKETRGEVHSPGAVSDSSSDAQSSSPIVNTSKTYPTRNRRPPDRLEL